MRSDNYWARAAQQVRTGQPDAVRNFTSDLGHSLTYAVRRALGCAPDSSQVARAVHALARQCGIRPETASPDSVEQIARLMARNVTAGLQRPLGANETVRGY